MAQDSFSISEVIPATPDRIYSAWLDPESHSAFTGELATVEPFVGGRHTAFGGYAEGMNIELHPGRRIVQTWRSKDFPEGSPDSRLEVSLEETLGGTVVTILHTDVPSGQSEQYRDGWVKFYLEPLKQFFTGGGEDEDDEEEDEDDDTLTTPMGSAAGARGEAAGEAFEDDDEEEDEDTLEAEPAAAAPSEVRTKAVPRRPARRAAAPPVQAARRSKPAKAAKARKASPKTTAAAKARKPAAKAARKTTKRMVAARTKPARARKPAPKPKAKAKAKATKKRTPARGPKRRK